jgi:hypothetical protein
MSSMRLLACLFVLLFVVAGCSQGERASRPAQSPEELLGVIWVEDEGGYVTKLDPSSLEPRHGLRVPLGSASGPWTFSPDGSRVAFGGDKAVRIIDLKGKRVSADLPKRGVVGAIAWPEPSRLLVATGFNWERGVDALVLDPVAPRLVSRQALGGSLMDWARTPEGLLLLLGPPSGIGPARLVVFSARKGIRVVHLARVPAGFESEKLKRGFSVDHFRTPGLAFAPGPTPGLPLAPGKGRAFVAWAADEIAEVDLASLRVTYHALDEETSLLGRLRDWLEPPAEAKGATDGSLRRALWLGNGLLAVYGFDDHAYFSGGSQDQRTTPAGLRLVDTGSWTWRVLEPRATAATLAGRTLLVFGSFYSSETGLFEGMGLGAYTLEGEKRFHRFEAEPIWLVETAGSYAYVVFEDSCVGALVELHSGRHVRDLEAGPDCNWPSLLVPEG